MQLPARLTTKTDDFTTSEMKITTCTVDGDTGDLAAPADAVKAPAITGPPPATVAVEELAKGVWYLAGGSHHSALVEFADHLTLIEAPQNETRALAVIAKAREVVPGSLSPRSSTATITSTTLAAFARQSQRGSP